MKTTRYFDEQVLHKRPYIKRMVRSRDIGAVAARDNRMAEFAIGDGFSTPRTENLVYCGS